jgi:hypothetical protein
MSDSGNKDNPPPSSRRTQRYQQQNVEQPHKRTLLKVLGIGAGLTGLGGIGLAWKTLTDPKTERATPAQSPTNSGFQFKPTPETAISQYENIKRRLHDLDKRMSLSSDSFKELAPAIGDIAIQFFCKEMDYDPKNYQGKINYLSDQEYKKAKIENANCIIDKVENDLAGVLVNRSEVNLNLDRILYPIQNQKIAIENPAIGLFGVIIHELFHVTTPLVPDPEDSSNLLRGLGILKPDPIHNKGDLTCHIAFRAQLEEAIVEDATVRLINKVGIGGISPSYESWVNRYRRGVVDRFFNGNNMPLLRLHQKSASIEFFRLIGEKLGVFSPEAQKQAGESYLTTLITQGIS